MWPPMGFSRTIFWYSFSLQKIDIILHITESWPVVKCFMTLKFYIILPTKFMWREWLDWPFLNKVTLSVSVTDDITKMGNSCGMCSTSWFHFQSHLPHLHTLTTGTFSICTLSQLAPSNLPHLHTLTTGTFPPAHPHNWHLPHLHTSQLAPSHLYTLTTGTSPTCTPSQLAPMT